jgi:hypothetical protein
MELNEESITFGKYKGKTLTDLLKDRRYCEWFKTEEDFKDKYVYIYNKVSEYNPSAYFFIPIESTNVPSIDSTFKDFIIYFSYFNLTTPENLKINLSEEHITSYTFYLETIQKLKTKLINAYDKGQDNPYDIKAPVKWLQEFETRTSLSRSIFKDFIYENDLLNITSILELIKKNGGIQYNGAQSYKIAKKNSEEQECFWEKILKDKYEQEINVQFKFENCFFDFIYINENIIYECKLGMKDFNKEQYKKYLLTLNKYTVIYLIGYDTIIDIKNSIVYVQGEKAYEKYIIDQKTRKKKTHLDDIVSDFNIQKVEKIESYI